MWLSKVLRSFRLNRKPKGWLVDNKYEVVPAFTYKGETYYMHKDPLNTFAGRGMTALVHMQELLMRCDERYLKDHTAAVNEALKGPKIDIGRLALLNRNLEERVNLLIAVPDHVFKMASVVFFTEKESPYYYDHKTGLAKIEEWKNTEGMYGFFLQTPLKDLIPSLALPEQNSHEYLQVVEKINDLHVKELRAVLFNKT